MIPGVAEAARQIADGTLTSERLVAACLDAVQAREPEVGAFSFVDADAALAAARRKDRGAPTGPLHGIPFGVKDIVDVAGWPTTYGSSIFHSYVSPRDAGCVALLKEAGAICLGKTVSTELGHVFPGKTRNPRDLARTPGGSSSGSAAAVAAGMVPFALGTQTTGSVIRPAAFCGIVGYKPTYGDVTNSGVFTNAASFDTVGAMSLALADLPLLRAALTRSPARPLRALAPQGLQIGIPRLAYWPAPTAGMLQAIADTADALRRRGVTVIEMTLPEAFEGVPAAHRQVSGFEFCRALSWERLERADQLSRVLREGRLADGLTTTIEAYHQASDHLAGLRMQFADLMQGFDALLTPAAPGEAPLGLGSTGNPVFNTIFSALHVPILTLPLVTDAQTCPLGLQLVGRRREDASLFDVAETVRLALAGPD